MSSEQAKEDSAAEETSRSDSAPEREDTLRTRILRRSPTIPKRPPFPRDELLRMLRDDEPLSIGEIADARKDGRLTDDDMEKYKPKWMEMERGLRRSLEPYIQQTQANLRWIVEPIRSTAQAMAGISHVVAQARVNTSMMTQLANTYRQDLPSLTTLPKPEVVALTELRREVVGLAEISATTGEHISSLASLASNGLEGMLRTEVTIKAILQESAQLRASLDEGQKTAARSASRIAWLTWAIVFLTVALVILTAVLVIRGH